jgi:hypothetical protein
MRIESRVPEIQVSSSKLGGLLEAAVESDAKNMAKKAVKRRLHVCCSDNETAINPLPGYD